MTIREITDEEIATYRQDGVVCLRGLFDDEWVERMRTAADRSLDQPSEMAIEMAEAQGDEGRFFFDTFVWRSNAMCRRFVFESPAAEIAGRLMASSRVNLFFDQWLIKEPGTETPTPWHHDLPYWPIQGDQAATIWLALDHVDLDNGAVEYVRGSHRWGERYFPQTFSGMDGMNEELPRVPDIGARTATTSTSCTSSSNRATAPCTTGCWCTGRRATRASAPKRSFQSRRASAAGKSAAPATNAARPGEASSSRKAR